MKTINGYELEADLTADNSGFSKWGFARKNGKTYFIKEFLSPVYPVYAELLTEEVVERKKKLCSQYEEKMKKLYTTVNNCSDGNLVRIDQFFRYGSKYYITTEKIESVDRELVYSQPLSVKIRLCRVLLHTVLELHRQGVVHSDIKEDNILYKRLDSGAITAKLIDFDSCFREDAPPSDVEEIHGDMWYMAPEVFRIIAEEKGKPDSAMDVFALGLVFHQILTGKQVGFDVDKYSYPFEALLNGDTLHCDSSVPEKLRPMLTGMLQKDPEKRIRLEDAWLFFEKKQEKTKTQRSVSAGDFRKDAEKESEHDMKSERENLPEGDNRPDGAARPSKLIFGRGIRPEDRKDTFDQFFQKTGDL